MTRSDMPPQPKKRYPFDRLYSLLALRLASPSEGYGGGGLNGRAGVGVIAAFLGENPRTVQRWRHIGVDRDQADRLAVRSGLLPYEVWPEWLDDSIADVLEMDARRAEQRNARQNAWARERYATDAEFREKQLAYQAQLRADPRISEAKRRYRREFYKKNRERELARQREYDARKAAERREASAS